MSRFSLLLFKNGSFRDAFVAAVALYGSFVVVTTVVQGRRWLLHDDSLRLRFEKENVLNVNLATKLMQPAVILL